MLNSVQWRPLRQEAMPEWAAVPCLLSSIPEAAIKEYEASIKAEEEELAAQEEVIRQLEQAIEEERKRLEEAERLKYDGGVFAFPLATYTRVTSNFGHRTHPITGKPMTMHYGGTKGYRYLCGIWRKGGGFHLSLFHGELCDD